jgi:hypothetical protein
MDTETLLQIPRSQVGHQCLKAIAIPDQPSKRLMMDETHGHMWSDGIWDIGRLWIEPGLLIPMDQKG